MDIATFKAPLENTAWIDGPDGSRFHIRSTESDQYRQRLLALGRKHQHRLKRDTKLQQEVTIQAMADTILLDWEGITDNGTPVACTLETRLQILAIPEIRDLVASEAQDLANFRREAVAKEAAEIKSLD
jgi:hypothetical protein